MRRIFCLLLAALLLLSLCACGVDSENQAEFFYRRVKFAYGTGESDGVIVSESRDITSHTDDLPYLISLYLVGPQDEALASPFPAEVRLISAEKTRSKVQIELSEIDSGFSDSAFSLACACMTLTCIELTGVTQVTIVSGERSVTLRQEDLTLYDSDTVNPATIETTMEVPQ